MKVRIPQWASDYKDEGIITFIAFAMRVSERYGFDEWYSVNKEDLSIICNKRQSGLIEWLREVGVGDIEVGDILEHTCMFKMPMIERCRRTKTHNTYELKDPRQKMVWMYLLGAFNYNMLTNKPQTSVAYRPNSWHIPELKITREALKYIKISDKH